MRNLLIFLILTLTVSIPAVADTDVPTADQVRAVWDYNQDAIIGMVQKLYILECAVPVIVFPALSIVETNTGQVVVSYSGTMSIDIGISPDILVYEVAVEPKDVTVAMLPEKEGLPWWVYAAGGVVLFSVGVVTGVLSVR